MSTRRSKRNANKNKTPSSSHYVGYVEDEESIESIMKKFEAVDKYKEKVIKEKGGNNENGKTEKNGHNQEQENGKHDIKEEDSNDQKEDIMLDENQYEEIFKITSGYAVQNTIEEDFNYIDEYEEYSFSGSHDEEEIDESFNEGDEENFFNSNNEEDSEQKQRRKNLQKKLNGSNGSQPRKNGSSKPRGGGGRSKKNVSDGGSAIQNFKKRLTCEVTDENGYKYTIRKKVKAKDPLKEVNVKIPKDTASWARDILPYDNEKKTPEGSSYLHVENIVSIDWNDKENNKEEYLAILMDPPWKCQSKEGVGVDTSDLKKMSLPASSLFIFIWTEKEMITSTVILMEDWNYSYVENFVWVKKQVNNRFFEQESSYFAKSKLTLLIFRKNVKDPVELRHQRSPDVFFDQVRIKDFFDSSQEYNRFSSYGREGKPLFAYHLIETLLPTGNYSEKTGHGKFLHLWSDLNYHRKGWTTVYS